MKIKQCSQKLIPLFALTMLFLTTLACGTSSNEAIPTFDPNLIQTAIAGTFAVSQLQTLTASAPINTPMPDNVQIPTATPIPVNPPLPTNTTQQESPDSPKGDGFYTVGAEIAPGKWESTGNGNSCYWQRLDDKQETIANHFGLAGGTITIQASDYEVQLKDCGTWYYVEGLAQNIQGNATEPKGDGFYTVGVEIVAGKWSSSGSGDSCYWQRLDDKQETIDNHFGLAGGTITIQTTDYEVQFKDCGIWNYLGN